jgi:anti-sigma regulatory factor (Ser/Thr protein kinase)
MIPPTAGPSFHTSRLPVTPVKKAAAVSSLRISLPRDISSPAEARRQVRQFAAGHGVDDPTMLLLVVSELVTNAVVHGAEPIEMCAWVEGGTVRVEVSDSDPDISTVVTPPRASQQVGGRGLEIVDSVTRSWGAIPNDTGKIVWAELESNSR